jgi:hypothetical protein
VDVDWGTRVARITKAQIIRFILEVCAEWLDAPEPDRPDPRWKQVIDLLKGAEKLSDEGFYGLVARET